MPLIDPRSFAQCVIALAGGGGRFFASSERLFFCVLLFGGIFQENVFRVLKVTIP